MTLRAHIVVAHGSLSLDMWLNAAPGEVVALLGPDDAGKTTILRCIAGLMAIDRGSIEVRGEIVDDPSANVFVPSAQRSAGVMSHQHQLFPHMSVLENVAFGLRARGVDKSAARQEARHWLRRVAYDGIERSRPEQLSDAQTRRVALARALACEPNLLLLDDPLGALDPATQVEIRRELRRHLAEFRGSAVLVTHNPIDAFLLADRVVIVENGHVVQDGTFAAIATHPRSTYVAELVGLNLLPGSMMGGVFAVDGGATLVVAAVDIDGPAIAVIRPQAVSLHATKPQGGHRNAWMAAVIDIDRRAERVRVRLQGPVQLTAEITASVADALGIKVGRELWASVMATDIAITLN
ncbi:MAG: ATP-binding cassette domain-containing protein [Ilumatobacteraceae bacterium]|nr:ATP-binding cassette domain-containing protein [Ilumatobacteraceae bacterium]